MGKCLLDKHKGLSSGPSTHANSQMYVPVGSGDKGGLLGFARQPKQTMASSGLSERLCPEEIKLGATEEQTSTLLWLLYT